MTEKNETPLDERLASEINDAIFRVTGIGIRELAAIGVLNILQNGHDGEAARLRSELEAARQEHAANELQIASLMYSRDAAIKRAETAEAAKDVAQEILNVVTAERRRQDRNSDYTSCCHDDPSKPCIDDTFDELDKVQAQRDRLVEALKRLHDQHHDCMFVYGEKDLEHTPECMCLAELLSSIGGGKK